MLSTRHALLLWAKEALQQAELSSPWHEARLLLRKALGVSQAALIAYPEEKVSLEEKELFQDYVLRRLKREPVSRIVGEREFWSLHFKISPATLDPRPDSETLIEAILQDYPHKLEPLKILDLGTGSGCLLLALLTEYPQAFGVGIDINFEALLTARKNAGDLGVGARAFFAQGTWGQSLHQTFDIILSNPPYIPRADIPTLEPEVRLYDPLQALEGGEDGLACYQALASGLTPLTSKTTRLYLEIGQGQEEKVEEIFKKAAYTCLRWHKDLAGIKRCGVFIKTP